MALFAKKTKEDKETKREVKISKVNPVKKQGEKESRTGISKITDDIILEPWITEKSHGLMATNKYVFQIHSKVDKKKVKRAIQTMYNVKVNNVNIINIPSKKRTYGRFKGKKSGYKKAVVTLKDGDRIDLFKGV
jgi:large subunit ribosomal protein L23